MTVFPVLLPELMAQTNFACTGMPAIWRDERRNIWGIFRTMHCAFRARARHFAQVKRRQSDARSAERFNQLYQDVRTSLTI